MTDEVSIYLYRCLCEWCGSDNLWFDPLMYGDVIVHCFDCGEGYLQTENGDRHRLPESYAN
jgi:hypothetical protein